MINKYDSATGQAFFLTGAGLLTFFSLLLLLSGGLLPLGITVSPWYFPLALVLTLLLNYFISSRKGKSGNKRDLFRSAAAVVGIVGLSILIAGSFYDTSWDGQRYHLESVCRLKEGWNPCHTFLPPAPGAGDQWLYVNYYPKAVELCEASIYSFTGKVETGKAINIMLMAAAFCLVYALLSRLRLFSAGRAVIYSLILTLNPIAVNQVLTYYIDGALASLLLCLLAVFVFMLKEESTLPMALMGLLMMALPAVKFTSLFYAVLLAAGFSGWLLWQRRYRTFRRAAGVALAAGIVSVALIGYSPYVVNPIQGRHPLYPVMGKDKVDIMNANLPAGFDKKGRLEKFLVSFFSRTSNEGSWSDQVKQARIKMPLTVHRSEIGPAKDDDTRIAGFGPLFSGIMLIALLVLFILSLSRRREFFTGLFSCWYMAGILLLSVLLVPESWWARFVPQLWFVPAVILLFADGLRPGGMKWIRPAIILLYCLYTVNILISLLSIPSRWANSTEVRIQMEQLKASSQPVKVQWGRSTSARARFMENDIRYVEGAVDPRRMEVIKWSEVKFERPDHFPPPPNTFSLRMLALFKKTIGK